MIYIAVFLPTKQSPRGIKALKTTKERFTFIKYIATDSESAYTM